MSEEFRGQSEQAQQETEKPQVDIIEYSDKYKEEVVKLVNEIYENELEHHSNSGRPDLHIIPEMYQRGASNFWVAIENERLVGTIALLDEGEQRGSMHRFCVDKNFRKKGIGAQLFSALKKFAEYNGYKRIFLSTWEDKGEQHKFYAKNGFRKIESLPEDIAGRSYFVNDDAFYELELEIPKSGT